MQKQGILISLLFLVFTNTIAQLGGTNTVNMPTVIPPSPEAASITKFVDMKINEYQGMVQHQIPIYQITDGSINLPISLNYQSGGFKVIESSSSIGLGWSLNAGGVVTRSMNGLPDDITGVLNKGFLQMSSELDYNYLSHGPQDQLRYSYLQAIGQGCSDSQPDIFNFSFNGYSGKFHFDWDGNILIASESEISITPIQNNGPTSRIAGWNIKTPDGFTYTFSSIETTDNIASGTNLCYLAQGGYTSAWYLTEITDPFNKRKLFFEYDSYTINDHYIHKSTSKIHLTGGDSRCNGNISGELNYNTTNIDIQGRILRRIYSNTSPVEVLFIPGTKKVMNTSNDFFATSEIQIKDSDQNQIIKKYKLEHSFATGRLTLISVQEFGKTTTGLPPYEFSYHGSLPSRTSYQKDHWGFTNNNSSQDLLPFYSFNYGSNLISSGTADRSPDFEGSRNGILYKVKYPTGGYDEYTFEQNTYGYVASQQIDEFKSEKITKYVNASGRYGIPCTTGSIYPDTDYSEFTITNTPGSNDPDEEISVKISGYVRKFQYDYFGAGQAPKVQLKNSAGDIIQSITLINNNVNKSINLTPGVYTLVAYATWKDCNSGTFDKAYASLTYTKHTNERLYEKPTGGVRVKTISKYDSNDVLLLSQEYDYKKENGYSSGFIHRKPNYVFSKETILWIPTGNNLGINVPCQYTVALDSDRSSLGISTGGHMGYNTVTITQKGGVNSTNGKTVLNFTGGANVIYDEFPFPPPVDNSFSAGKTKSSQIINSSGTTLRETTNDYQNKETLTNALKINFKGGATMNQDNFVIARYRVRMAHISLKKQETKTHLNGDDHITSTEYVYKPSLRKLKEKTLYNSDRVHKQVLYYPEDHALLDNVSQAEANTYQNLANQFRIANPIHTEDFVKVGNSAEKLISKSRVKYASNTSTSNLIQQIAIETAKSNDDLENRAVFARYDDFGNILQYKKAESSITSYVWSYNKMYPVAKIENASFTEVANALGISESALMNFNENSLSTLNVLRSNLPNAMVTTYAYSPLVGIISMTDPRGYSIYYEYDEFNRLEFVKDAQGKLISENKYNYANN